MSITDPLQIIKDKSASGFRGILRFGEYSAFVSDNRLLQVSHPRDTMWLLRRMVCCGWINENYAHALKHAEVSLELHLFPFIADTDWSLLLLDRARQNLFDLSFLDLVATEDTFVSPQDDALASHEASELVDSFFSHRDRLFLIRSKLQEIWVQKSTAIPSHPILDSCPPTFALSELVVQSPWEEVDLLLEVLQLSKEGHIVLAESLSSMSSSISVEEETLFSDHDRSKEESHFVIARENLEKVVLPQKEDAPEIAGMLDDVNLLLGKISQTIDSDSKRDWLQDLIHTAPKSHKGFFSLISISSAGTLVLTGRPSAIAAFQALGSLILRAARSPFVKDGRRDFINAVNKWGQKWSS